MELGRHLQEQVVLPSLLVRDGSGWGEGHEDLGQDRHELQDEVVDSDDPEQVVESDHLLWWNEECAASVRVNVEQRTRCVLSHLRGRLLSRKTKYMKRTQATKFIEMASSAPRFLLACLATCHRVMLPSPLCSEGLHPPAASVRSWRGGR